MTIEVSDDNIFDCRNRARVVEDRDEALRLAAQLGYKFFAWNGTIVSTATDAEVFWPPAGFWIRSSLPFVGWKTGYSYKGTNRWLLCDETVGFAVIPLRK
jgi:hypothetical protein